MNRYSQRVMELEGRPMPFRGVVTEEVLLLAEQKIGYPLPEGYREFLQDYGGFMFSVSCPVKDRRDGVEETDFSFSYSLNLHSTAFTYDLLWKYQDDVSAGVMATEILPIGGDDGGNQVCICMGGENLGKVYFWYHDKAGSPFDYSCLYLIADSFDEFMQSLFLHD
jgi:hypothetical protein